MEDNRRRLVAVYGASFFCAGLGSFAEGWRQQYGVVQVIHSTPLWLLAEFGIVGAVLVLLPLTRVTLISFAQATEAVPMSVLAFLTCLVFATFAAAHEVLYQRPLWLLLGVALTLGCRPWSSVDAEASEPGRKLV